MIKRQQAIIAVTNVGARELDKEKSDSQQLPAKENETNIEVPGDNVAFISVPGTYKPDESIQVHYPEVKDEDSLLLLCTRHETEVTELQKKVQQLTQNNQNVEASFVQVRSNQTRSIPTLQSCLSTSSPKV